MSQQNLLILERSSQNLQKITRNGKTTLEGVFAEFGVENRNGRIYEENEYLPHLEYLKKDIASGNLLGELDHPERFEVALGGVSHRITELWYDQQKRQVLGRIEILDTPKGQIAKSLLEANIPLSISSRAAGTVNEDKKVSIQQIYTFDLVAKPGFEAAQLHKVNESANPRQAEINQMITSLNESCSSRREHSINSQLGIINENLSIIDLSDKFPHLDFKPEVIKAQKEVKKILENKNKENNMAENKSELMNEDAVQQWTVYFNKKISAINERIDEIQKSGDISELGKIKKYIEKMRKIQEQALNWQSEIAKAVNEVANYADTLADKSNKHYKLTRKIVETVDHNAKTLNKTQDWTGEIAKVTNAIGETVDHNAKMLNGLNEWTGQIAKGVNRINEWNEEIAPAVNDLHDWTSSIAKATNGMHEWTSSIAKNVNHVVNYTEDMLGRAVSKEEAIKLMEYVELVAESKSNPELKSKIDEMLRTHSITSKPLNEVNIKGIAVLDTVSKVGNVKVDDLSSKNTSVEFDDKSKTIVSKLKNIRVGKGKLPIGDKSLQMDPENKGASIKNDDGCCNDPKELKTGLKKHQTISYPKSEGPSGPTSKSEKNQNMKLDVKPEGKLKENIQERKNSLDDKLSKIITNLEKEKSLDESVKTSYPFTSLLSESDRKRFNAMDVTDKEKVVNEIAKNPTTDANVIIKLWENAIAKDKVIDPLWLTLAPKAYKEAYDKATDVVKESINAKAEFFKLNTQYQINNFWETSGIISKPTYTLNESVTAINPEENQQNLDSFVAQVAEGLKKYNPNY